MAIITLTSDFGHRDAYAAIVKASILGLDPTISIIDISHEIEAANIAHGAFVLNSAYRNFPGNTVHIVAVDSLGGENSKIIAAEIEGHFFIGADNGLFSLISEREAEKVVIIEQEIPSTFPARDSMAAAAVNLNAGALLEELGEEYSKMKKFFKRIAKANKEEIIGHVAHVDNYGNLITNIKQNDFEFLVEGKKYIIGIGREQLDYINKSTNEVEPGDCFVLFNHLGVLEIGIKNGHAAQLLGMQYDSQVWIKFS